VRRPTLWATIFVAAVTSARAGAVETCVGDCPPTDQQVAVNELVVGVNVALGSGALDACPSYDANGNGAVGVEELIVAVNNAAQGCPGGPTPLPSATPTPTVDRPTGTPTVTATAAPGPVVGFFGVTSSDDTLQPPTATAPGGIPIYQRSFGFGFSLVVEAKPGSAQRQVANNTFAVGGPPDLQIQATRDLGNGSAAVCDNTPDPPGFGGVPGIDPPRLDDSDTIADALNDFGCRFIDGTGAPSGRACALGCIHFDDGEFGCQQGDTQTQFCAPIGMPLQFPAGDTLVTARVRDLAGNLGPPARLIIRIAP
jgi:hypothetical protein